MPCISFALLFPRLVRVVRSEGTVLVCYGCWCWDSGPVVNLFFWSSHFTWVALASRCLGYRSHPLLFKPFCTNRPNCRTCAIILATVHHSTWSFPHGSWCGRPQQSLSTTFFSCPRGPKQRRCAVGHILTSMKYQLIGKLSLLCRKLKS